jgi:MFS transporter, DHA1 family, inner membrane transport protein
LSRGLSLSLLYLTEPALGPAGRRSLLLTSFAGAAALTPIGLGAIWVGIVVAVLVRGLMQLLLAPVLAQALPGGERVAAIATMSVWRDLVAGTAPLIAGLLLPLAPFGLYSGSASRSSSSLPATNRRG